MMKSEILTAKELLNYILDKRPSGAEIERLERQLPYEEAVKFHRGLAFLAVIYKRVQL